jgi:clan AA aspartic protease
MIDGVVTDLQARVEVVLRLAARDDHAVECIVDTGFQGELALPPALITALQLPARGRIWANLADGRDVPIPTFSVVIHWNDQEIDVTVMAMGNRPLLGTEILQGFNLSIDFEEDGELSLTPL